MPLCQDLIFSRLGSSMHVWSMIASAILLAVVASAQVPARTHSTLVLPIPGFVKRRAEARILKTALADLKALIEGTGGSAATSTSESAS